MTYMDYKTLNMNIIKRILTMKSKLGFGKYAELTVAQMFETKRECALISIYCNLSKIDYNEEILDKLFIEKGFRIAKPGTATAMKDALIKHFIQQQNKQLTKDEILGRIKYFSNAKKRRKISSIARIKMFENISQNKKSLAWRNQGHL
jgi:hypothetical protein